MESTALIYVAALLVKHFIGDFILQTPYMLHNKHRYGHPGGLLHAALHGGMTLVILSTLPLGWLIIAGLSMAEAILHYHIDWLKERIARARGWSPAQPAFWHGFGFDQLLHHLTYVALAAVIISLV